MSKIGKNQLDAEEDHERRQGENPDARLPPMLEAVEATDARSPALPGLQVARLEHAAPDAHPEARLPALRARVEAAPRDADHVSEVQVAALADAEAATLSRRNRMAATAAS